VEARHELDDAIEVLARDVVRLLGGRRIAAAESCTAGRITTALACVEGAATFLAGGVVAYATDVKRSLLDVTAPSVLSIEAVEQMARGVADLLGAEVGVSTSGVAGETSEDGVRPGTVFIATSVDGRLTSREHHLGGAPEDVAAQAARQALDDLEQDLRAVHER